MLWNGGLEEGLKFVSIVGSVLLALTGSLFAQGGPVLVVSPGSLSFALQNGLAPPPPALIPLHVTSSGAVNTVVSVSTDTGTNWLNLSGGGATPADVIVSLNVTPFLSGGVVNYPAGVYHGAVTISAAGASNSPLIVPVTLTITGGSSPPQLSIDTTSLSFDIQLDSDLPAASIAVSSSTGAPLAFSASAASAGNWLSVLPASGTTPSSVAVSANPAGLSPGIYQGNILLASSGASGGVRSVAVSLTVRPVARAVQNTASWAAASVAPGEIVSIFGLGLGPVMPALLNPPASGVADTMLAGTRIWFDSFAAPLLFVSYGQVNAVVPYELAGNSSALVQVEINGVKSAGTPVRVVDSFPGVFTIDQTGTGPAAVLNEGYSVNSAANPAAAGSVVMIYATGEGQTTPAGVDGLISNATLRKPTQLVTVTIGGQAAELLYAGSAPGLISGVIQINARVPLTAGPGVLPIVVKVGDASSQAGATIAVQ